MIEPAVPYVVGFILGYLSFELTEWRRRRIRQTAIQRALRTELEAFEQALNASVFLFSIGTENAARAVKALRSFYANGGISLLMVDVPEINPDFLQQSDEQLEEILRGWEPLKSPVGMKIATPILDGVTEESFLTQKQMQALAAVKWHLNLLNQEADWMNLWLRMTFELDEPENYAAAEGNRGKAQAKYGLRARILLDAVGAALNTLKL